MPVSQTSDIVNQVVFSREGTFHSTDETIVWRDPGGS